MLRDGSLLKVLQLLNDRYKIRIQVNLPQTLCLKVLMCTFASSRLIPQCPNTQKYKDY